MPKANLRDAQPVTQPQGGRASLADVSGTGQGYSPNYGPDVQVVNPTWGEIGKGTLREGAQLLAGGHNFGKSVLEMIPGVKDSAFDQAMQRHQAELDTMAPPQNTGEAMGKTGAEMVSYLLPAKLESGAVEGLPRVLQPVGRIAAGALSGGVMNKLNGGSFRAGALTGGAMTGMGEMGRGFLAPALTRSAIPGIGKDTANAVLDETRGIRPSTVLKNTSNRIGQASNDLDNAVLRAELRPTPRIKGFLMPPREEIPLQSSPDVSGRPSRPVILHSGRPVQRDFPGYGVNQPVTRANMGDIPGEAGPIPEEPTNGPQRFNGMTAHEYIGQRPGTQGGTGQPQGVLLRRPEMSGSVPPTLEPNRMLSTDPAQQPVRSALETATRQRVPGDVERLQRVLDFIHGNGEYGPTRPESLTPREMLDARRGYGRNFVSNREWNQAVNSPVMAATKQGYGGLTGELHAKVPGSVEADEMMHRLMPAEQSLKQLVRRDPSIATNVMGRFAPRTGALTSMAVGAAGGARAGGVPGMVAGGGLGLVVPEVLSSPTAKMAMARTLNSTVPPKFGRMALGLWNAKRSGTGGPSQ